MPVVQVATIRSGLELRSLLPGDGSAYADLLRSSAEHLTRHGDYVDAVAAPADVHAAAFAELDPRHNFGIYENDVLVGSVELVPHDPPKFGLGYLLAHSACGRGIATLAVHAAAGHARSTHIATDLFAGVTHGNHKSIAVLQRVGFARIATFETYARYHLDLARLPAIPRHP